MARILIVLNLFFLTSFSVSSEASISFNIEYLDVVNMTGVGFDDPTLGASRQATFNSVFGYLNTVLDHTGAADIQVQQSQNDGGGFLASAGPFRFVGPNGFTNGFAFDQITTGFDQTGAVPDATVTFDFGFNWNSELDAPASNEFDLFSVALHEIGHVLGVGSVLNADGTSAISGGDPGDPGVFAVYDSFLERGDGTALFAAGGEFVGTPADLVSDDLFFNGANAVAANGGERPRIFAPTTFNDGSSLSHVDASVDPNGVLQFSTPPGQTRRTFNGVEIGILQDIGFTVSSTATAAATAAAVPEPSSFLFILASCVGMCVRRNRRSATNN